MTEHQSIKDTLDVIRKALKDDYSPQSKNIEKNILILDRLVNEDGTINQVNGENISKEDVTLILDKKLDETFEKYLFKWLDNNIPKYIKKYIKNKNF